MREAEFSVPHVLGYLDGEGRDLANPFAEHMVFCEKGADNLEDMVDLFWEKPFTFSALVHRFHREEMIDAFAGRVYETEHQPSRAILAFRKMPGRTRSRWLVLGLMTRPAMRLDDCPRDGSNEQPEKVKHFPKEVRPSIEVMPLPSHRWCT